MFAKFNDMKKLNEELLSNGKAYCVRWSDKKILSCDTTDGMHPYIIYDGHDSIGVNISGLFYYNPRFLIWFYDNTAINKTRKDIKKLVTYFKYVLDNLTDGSLDKNREGDYIKTVIKGIDFSIESLYVELEPDNKTYDDLVKSKATSYEVFKDIVDLLYSLHKDTNEEFLRIRTGSEYVKNGDGDEIYFRIGSTGKNWFDTIWKIVYDNQTRYKYVTVETDWQSDREQETYLIQGKYTDHMPVQYFINLKGNPVIEELDEPDNKLQETLDKKLLLEKTRQQLINKSKASDDYKNTYRGRNRWERRRYSQVANSVRDYNNINMDAFWKGDILDFVVKVKGETDDYQVTITFDNILNNLQKEVKSNRNKLEFKCVLRALLDAFNNGNILVSCTCLHPDTKIKLLDGTTSTVKEMCERFNNGEKLYTYSVDKNGDFKPGEVEKVWMTKVAKEFIKVTLDNGEEILTTPEHPYMLRDGSYRFAEDLKEGQSLMSMYFNSSFEETIKEFKLNHKVTKIERVVLDETPVYDIKVKEWENFVVDDGVVLHNCPDWIYRQDYWSTMGGYNSGKPQTSNGRQIVNPNDTKGAGCKHVNLVISNTDWMMKIASVINNYIKYCKDNLQRIYADYMFPKIYGMPYNKSIQLSLFDTFEDEDSGWTAKDREKFYAQVTSDVVDDSTRGRDLKGRFLKKPQAPRSFSSKSRPVANDENQLSLFDNTDDELTDEDEETFINTNRRPLNRDEEEEEED